MNIEHKKWGIDLRGRKMRYEPWPVTIQGNYRQPTEEEIDKVFGISGEAVSETLLYFEECKGDTEELIRLLNEHSIDNRFMAGRQNLKNVNHWYTHEYYFYFIMFTKVVMNDYTWHFSKGEGVQLSKYHKIYEYGFLDYVPYGEDNGNITNSLPQGMIKHYTAEGYDFTDLYLWADALTRHKTNIGYKTDVSKLDNYWLEGEFVAYLYSFIMILVNKSNAMEMAHECFHSFFLEGFSYVPETMLATIIPYFTKKSTNYFKVEMKYNKNNSINFMLTYPQNHIDQSHIYNISRNYTGNSLMIAAYQQVIKKLLKLDELPPVKNITGIHSECCTFTIQWEKRILAIPYVSLFVCNLSAILLLFLNQILKWEIASFVLLLLIPVNIILIIIRRLKIAKYNNKVLNDHMIKIIDDNIKRLEKAEELSHELMHERVILEQRVKERTAELTEANERLKELDKVKTDFLANVSHELRTPLTLMIGPIESIVEGEYGNTLEKDNEIFTMILFNGSKLLRLINNLLDFTKIEAQKMRIVKRRTDITGLIRFYTSMIKPYVESKRLSIAFNNNCPDVMDPAGKIIAYIDTYLLERVLFNLLSNAIKFTPAGGNIIVQLDREENSFKISIKDTGIGIPEDKLKTIFDRFTQIDSSLSRKYEGTGIGLSLTRELIKIMDGTLTVSSRLGQGSVFSIDFPYGKKEEIDSGEQIEETQETGFRFAEEFNQSLREKFTCTKDGNINLKSKTKRKKILIVEDSVDMQKFLTSILENEYILIYANSGKEGLQVAERDGPDLILADVMMPEMDGYEMTAMIKSTSGLSGIPVILLTAKAELFMKLTGFEKGANDYIIKPFNSKELKARIKAHLDIKMLRDRVVRQRNAAIKQWQILREALEQKEAAWKQLSENEKRFHEMAEYLPAAIVEINNEKKITYLNQIGYKLFELSPHDLSGNPKLIDFLEPADKERFIKNLEMNTGLDASSGLYEYRFVSKHHNTFFGLFMVVTLYCENQKIGNRAIITEIRHYLNLALLPDDSFFKKYKISPREKDVFVYMLKGYKNKDIGDKLFISERTVKKHIASILEKTDTKRRRDLFNLVRESGIAY